MTTLWRQDVYLQDGRRLGRAVAEANILQHAGKREVAGLAVQEAQLKHARLQRLPYGALVEHGALHARELQRVADQDEANAAKRVVRALANGARNRVELVQQVGTDHGHFIHDDRVARAPAVVRFGAPAQKGRLEQVRGRLAALANSRPAVQRLPANGRCGHARAASDCETVQGQGRNDGAEH